MAGSIPESTIEEIKGRIDLADLISSYGVQVRRAGSSYKACCPFHHEKTPSFNIQPDRGFYHCFGCGESGDAIKFVQKQEGLTFVEAVKKLAERCGVTIEEKEDPQAGLRKRLYAIHAELAAFYHRCLKEAKEAQRAREYLKSRSLDGDVAESFQLGYAPVSSAAMLKWAAKYKFKPEDLTAAGVLLPPRYEGGNWYNRFAGRLVFPIRDKMGRTLAFSCRTLETDKAKMRGGKYVNSSDSIIFKKSDVIYALDKASPRILAAPRREAIVCEGQIDVIRCHSCGFNTAVAGLGTSFTKEHVQLLKKCADSVVLVFDADGAGVKAARRTGTEFLAVDMPVRVATLPEGEDPDSFLLTQGAEAFQARLDAAESITSFLIRVQRATEPNPTSIAAVTRLSRAVLEMVAVCPSAIMRASLLSEAAQLLGLPQAALESDLADLIEKRAHPAFHQVSAAARPSTPKTPPVEPPPERPLEGDATVPSTKHDAAAPVNNPPPARELALCGFLFKHEGNREVADLIADCAPPELFSHVFTRMFVQAWLKGDSGGNDEFAAFCRNLAPEESRWFDRIAADERDSLCEQSPVRQLQELLRLLWVDATERRLGMLDAASTDENDRRRLELSMQARRFQRGTWAKIRSLMVPTALTLVLAVLTAVVPYAGECARIDLMKGPVLMRGSGFKGRPKSDKTLTENYYTAICDGKQDTFWEPMESRGPHFVEILWNQCVEADGVGWRFENIDEATLSRWRKGAWEKVAKVSGASGRTDFPLAASDRWKLSVENFAGTPRIREMSLFGPEQYVMRRSIAKGTDAGSVAVSGVNLPKGVLRPGDDIEISFDVSATSNTAPFGLMVELSDRAALDVMWDEGSDFCSGRWAARPDGSGHVRIKMELPPWTPHGSNDLIVTALSDKTGRQIGMPDRLLGTILVERPNMPPMPEPARQVSIGTNAAGQRGFVINGKWHPAFFNRYFGNPTPERLAATGKTGLNILYWQNRERLPVDEAGLQAHLDWFDRRVRMALRICPDNYFILSQVLKTHRQATDKWLEKYPNERMMLENGEPNPERLVSFGSDLYMEKSEEFVSRLVSFISSQPYGDRVIGYHFWTCTRNDGFIGGAMQNVNATRREELILGDYHPGVLKRFRAFLRMKYGGDVSRLRKAWRNENVRFEDAFVGCAELTREDMPGSAFRDPVRSRPAIDYLEFFPTLIGGYNRRLAAAVKRETGGKALVLLHSGAVKSFLKTDFARQLQSNNNDFADLLDDPNIDVFVQAQPYNTREAGNAMHVYQPVKSIDLHGKLYLFDHDHRTSACGFLRSGRHRSQYEGASIFRRDYGYQWIENSGAWISEMSYSHWERFWDERLPWYVTPEVYRPIRDTLAALGAVDSTPRRQTAEMAVVLSLNSPRYEDACRMTPLYKGLVSEFMLQSVLPFFGAPHDVILSSDLARPDLPDYKLYVFVNVSYLTAGERAAIDSLKRNGKTLAWFYAPGYSTDDGLSLDAARSVCGIRLKAKEEKAETPKLTFLDGTPLSDGLGGKKLETLTFQGVGKLSPTTMKPIFYADDPQAMPAGLYADGKVAYCLRDFGSWKSVWCGVPNFDLPALERLARYAGVHVYAEAPVVMDVDNRLMMLHNGYAGRRTIKVSLPRPAKVSDLFTGSPVANGDRFEVELDTPETRLLRLEYR